MSKVFNVEGSELGPDIYNYIFHKTYEEVNLSEPFSTATVPC